jgi:UDP-N-acetylglucosamine--N-acetylmuramyl-(pentapeptide) pyrophosphoryl-undecaprenol N-acetylglucosamine transferase
MRVLLAGGGTAGHTSPLLATADALCRLEPGIVITCLGTPRGLENRVVPEAGYPLELIPPVPLPRRPNADLLKVPARLRGAVRDAGRVMERTGAEVVLGFGGYVSMPAYLAARRRRLPIVLHEQNAVPGLANKAGARIARRVAVSFPDTPLPRAEYVGLPLRSMIARLDRQALRAEARRFFDLDPDRPTLLVTGGSQGARRLNLAVSGASAALAGAGVQVLHVVGPEGEADPAPGEVPYAVVPFVDRMDLAYAAADLVLCRGGASSVSEAAAVGLPAIVVPLPIGNGEQEHNARPVVDAGGALLVPDADLSSAWVAGHVVSLATDAARLAAMGAAAADLVPRDADERLARIVLEVARASSSGGLP